jgi:hypothetical protein
VSDEAYQVDRRGANEHATPRSGQAVGLFTTSELSITIVDQAQGQGIGAALLARLTPAARAKGIRRFRCEVLAENAGMRRPAQRLGGDARWLGDGTLEYDCSLPAEGEGRPDWGLPWLVDPDAWISVCSDAWLINLAQTLDQVQAANNDWDQRIVGACPFSPRSSATGRRAA